MTYKTLMVHMAPGTSNTHLLRITTDLAERFDAHVIGIAARQPMAMVYGDGYVSWELIEADRTETEKEMKEAEAEFRQALQGRAGAVTWRSTVMYASLSDYLAREARSADLFITGVASSNFFDPSRAVNTGDLIMQTGRPVLVVPLDTDHLRLERAIIGWKDSRETRRAVLDALPLLQKLNHVAVVEIAAEDELAAARSRLADVVAWLQRHGVTAQPQALLATGEDAAQLDAFALAQKADVFVAGAYGHSRLKEWALGGVTRDLLLRANRCALVSH